MNIEPCFISASFSFVLGKNIWMYNWAFHIKMSINLDIHVHIDCVSLWIYHKQFIYYVFISVSHIDFIHHIYIHTKFKKKKKKGPMFCN